MIWLTVLFALIALIATLGVLNGRVRWYHREQMHMSEDWLQRYHERERRRAEPEHDGGSGT